MTDIERRIERAERALEWIEAQATVDRLLRWKVATGAITSAKEDAIRTEPESHAARLISRMGIAGGITPTSKPSARRNGPPVARLDRARARKQLAEQLMTIADIDALLCSALVRVAAGRLDPGVGTAMATISKTITTIRTAGDLERRLEELERAAGIGPIRRIG